MDLQAMSVRGLLNLYSLVLQELTGRDVIRSTNNPVADYAEYLVVRALDLKRAAKSTKGYDATDHAGKRYEIKGRRITAHNPCHRRCCICHRFCGTKMEIDHIVPAAEGGPSWMMFFD